MKKTVSLGITIILFAALSFTAAASESELDTGRNADYLSEIEKDVILEVNKARTDPSAYAEEYLVPMREFFNGMLYQEPGGPIYRTNEGVRALDECIRVMTALPSLAPLESSAGLSRAAKDHVEDTGPRGMTGHTGSDRSNLNDRISRYAVWGSYIGENISYGKAGARGIVIQLLVDDGVSSRGHRDNLLKESFRYIGVSVGPHTTWNQLCVMDFAAEVRER